MNVLVIGKADALLSTWFESININGNNLTTYVVPSIEFAELTLSHITRCAAVIVTIQVDETDLESMLRRLKNASKTPQSISIAAYQSLNKVRVHDGIGWSLCDCSNDIHELGVFLGLYTSKFLSASKPVLAELKPTVDVGPSFDEMPTGKSRLTPRQKEVLQLVNLGKSNKEIARDLTLTEGTVKVHCKAIFRILGVSNRTQAAVMISKSGFDLAPRVHL